jgi:coenzyme F420-dependent glucose-6-phosphate dehydrogenase
VPQEYYTDDWHDPAAMYEHAEKTISDDAFKEQAIIASDPQEHVERIHEIEQFGPDVVSLMNISGHDPLAAVETYGEHVLPKLRAGART